MHPLMIAINNMVTRCENPSKEDIEACFTSLEAIVQDVMKITHQQYQQLLIPDYKPNQIAQDLYVNYKKRLFALLITEKLVSILTPEIETKSDAELKPFLNNIHNILSGPHLNATYDDAETKENMACITSSLMCLVDVRDTEVLGAGNEVLQTIPREVSQASKQKEFAELLQNLEKDTKLFKEGYQKYCLNNKSQRMDTAEQKAKRDYDSYIQNKPCNDLHSELTLCANELELKLTRKLEGMRSNKDAKDILTTYFTPQAVGSTQKIKVFTGDADTAITKERQEAIKRLKENSGIKILIDQYVAVTQIFRNLRTSTFEHTKNQVKEQKDRFKSYPNYQRICDIIDGKEDTSIKHYNVLSRRLMQSLQYQVKHPRRDALIEVFNQVNLIGGTGKKVTAEDLESEGYQLPALKNVSSKTRGLLNEVLEHSITVLNTPNTTPQLTSRTTELATNVAAHSKRYRALSYALLGLATALIIVGILALAVPTCGASVLLTAVVAGVLIGTGAATGATAAHLGFFFTRNEKKLGNALQGLATHPAPSARQNDGRSSQEVPEIARSTIV